MALIGFEDLTKELTDIERRKYVPMIVKGLKLHVGKDNAITNKKMRESLEFKYGWKITDTRMRKMIEYIRVAGKCFGVCASSKGYWVAANEQELKDVIDSQMQRVDQQLRTAKALNYQKQQMFNGG